MAHHIVSAEAAWLTESQAQVLLTFEDGDVVPVTVLLPPPPGPQQFWPDELFNPEVDNECSSE
jgi:hypothetical protein